MPKSALSSLLATLLCAACATVQPSACPALPPAPQMEPAPPALSYQNEMQRFLQGLLPMQTEPRPNYELVKPGSRL